MAKPTIDELIGRIDAQEVVIDELQRRVEALENPPEPYPEPAPGPEKDYSDPPG